jgi:hypothetical protein
MISSENQIQEINKAGGGCERENMTTMSPATEGQDDSVWND